LLERFSWAGELIWQVDIGNDLGIRNHHDIEPLPNGNILVIAGEYFSIIEAIENGRNPETLENKVSVDYVVELKPIGTNEAKIVWEWHFWDHLIQDFDEEKLNYGAVAKHKELLNINLGNSMNDWLHLNSIDYNAAFDQILVSSSYTNELYIIDHSTTAEEAALNTGGQYAKGGDFLWRWGNPQNYNSGVESDRKLFGQHDAKWILPGYPNEGGISVFNNNFSNQASAVHLISAPALANGSYTLTENKFTPNDFYWTFNDEILGNTFFNTIKSGMQVQANGNVLVSLGSGLFFEVTIEKQLVWAYRNPVVNDETILTQFSNDNKTEIFRAERYPINYKAFNNKNLSPKGIIENENTTTDNCRLVSAVIETESNNKSVVTFNAATNTLLVVTHQNNTSIKIVDVFGRLQFFSNSKKIDVSHLPKGLYYAIMQQPYFSNFSFIKM